MIGKLCKSMFLERAPPKPYSYFDMPDNAIDANNLADLIRHLVQYEEIHVYFGRFKNILSQDVSNFRVAAETDLVPADDAKKESITHYWFEPSLEEILVFFEREMFSSVFEQALHESQLAKFASRMIAMDQASEKIRESLKIVEVDNMRLTHGMSNKKQTNLFPGIIAFKAQYGS